MPRINDSSLEKSNGSQQPLQQPTPRPKHHADRNAAKGSSANAIAKVDNKTSNRLSNVELKIQQMAEQRQQKLDEYANAIAYLTDGDAFMAELAVLVDQKINGVADSGNEQNTVEATAITLDSLDPYASRSFEFQGKFFSGSTVALLGGN